MNFTKQNYNDKQIDKNESYNVVLNSIITIGASVSFNDVNYAIDWSFLPEQPYYVHFTYFGEVNNLDGNKIASLYVDFGAPSNTYYCNLTTSSTTSQFMGILKPYVLGTSSFLLAEDNTNPPIYLNSRPKNNQFHVQILDNELIPNVFTPTTGNLGAYIVHLRFVPVNNNQ